MPRRRDADDAERCAMRGRFVERMREGWSRALGGRRVARQRGELRAIRRLHHESEQRFRALLESLPRVAVQGYDRERRVIYWNAASERLYGYTAEEAMGRRLEELIIPAAMRRPVIEAHRAWIEQGREIPAEELELCHRSGEPVPVFSHHVMLGEHTERPLMFCVDVDLSDQKQAHRDLAFAHRFDRLTGLPNRQAFEADLDALLEQCRHRDLQLALIYLDIDHFVEINDALGYAQGDRLLIELAQRLRRHQRAGDLMSRVSGDEFVMAFPGVFRETDLRRLVDKVRTAFRRPFALDDGERLVSACLGLSRFPAHGDTARELIRNADVAKNRAKLDGRGSVQGFHQHFHDQLLRRHRLVDRLARAIERHELRLHYQPQVALVDGRLAHLEALLRWEPDDAEPVAPGEFIPLAEHAGLIDRLGDWVMNEACRQQAEWRAAGVDGIRVDINLSGSQVLGGDTLRRLEACVSRHGLCPADIGIELTENVLIAADERVLAGLRHLRRRGVSIAIDDFGTGYSSLSYLKHLPVSALKIDRTFVRDATRSAEDRAILEAAVFIGQRLGLEVVAEGVETAEQLSLLREMRCELAQGYFLHRPRPAEALLDLMRDAVVDAP
ncbi:putative bifunctional diguanylate cyclase/phosphodiesterase [Halomonas koreensis]|uniref:EAL domain-containing protein n=1 Tax=Halomonas koreensis TaxID=245385 RepID=A0ABU1G224_9GAMM|nr:EAL domain-containing protein [Halomonas koreensis]MDR5866998.1 EAL domain-containing protein [Halomonas koreensis]